MNELFEINLYDARCRGGCVFCSGITLKCDIGEYKKGAKLAAAKVDLANSTLTLYDGVDGIGKVYPLKISVK